MDKNKLEFSSNSHKSREDKTEETIEKKEIKPVVKANIKKKKGLHKLAELFLAKDIEEIRDDFTSDVLVPTIKKALADSFHSGINILFYGKTSVASKSPSTASQVSYNKYSAGYSKNEEPRRTKRETYTDVIFNTRAEAEEVLDTMYDMLSRYGMVSVADFLELCDITGEYTDNKYGWVEFRNVSVLRTRDGYIIKLPRAVAIV